jgi:hypothetical protein
MGQYSENVEAEFGELVRRMNARDTIRITYQDCENEPPITIEGVVAGIDHCILQLENAVLGEDRRPAKYPLCEIPLGGYIVKYEFLTEPKFDSTKEREAYHAKVAENWKRDPIHEYINYIFNGF